MDTLRRFFFSNHVEKLVSGLGALIAVFLVGALNALLIPDLGTPLVIASLGASAILLFATPHSPFTQPWSLFGGQLVSALTGVTCANYISNPHGAAALAVGLALVLMYYLRCLHPPGGATALSAVLGDETIHELGYLYVAAPVMLDTLAIMLVAILFNYLFPWRRYPLGLSTYKKAESSALAAEVTQAYLNEENLRYALTRMESFVDVSTRDLSEIYKLAAEHAEAVRLPPERVLLGHYYSNGRPGTEASVRKVIDESGVSSPPAKDKIIYRVIVGANVRATAACTRADFAHWAKYEVALEQGVWRKVD